MYVGFMESFILPNINQNWIFSTNFGKKRN